MEVLKEGKNPRKKPEKVKKFKVKCPNCGCVFTFTMDEATEYWSHAENGSCNRDPNAPSHYIKCPNKECTKTINNKYWKECKK